MNRELQAVLARLQALSEEDQARIAVQIDEYLTRLEGLREQVREGLESGPATPLEMDEIIRRGQDRLAALPDPASS